MSSSNFALTGLSCFTVFLSHCVNLLLNKPSHCLENDVPTCQQALHDVCWPLLLSVSWFSDVWSGQWTCPTAYSPSKCHAVSWLLFLFPSMLFSGMLLSLSVWRIPLYALRLDSVPPLGEAFLPWLPCVNLTTPQTPLHHHLLPLWGHMFACLLSKQ